MARLAQMPRRLGSSSSRIAGAPLGEAARSSFRRDLSPWRAWYGLARWKAKPHGLRWQVLVEAGFTCRRCQQMTRNASASDMVADHIKPHRGDPALFWARSNLQCLCKTCHDTAKQAEERAGL